MVLFTLAPVGYAANAMGDAGGPFAVYLVVIFASEMGKAVSKETKIDLLVTPAATLLAGLGIAWLTAAPVGNAANSLGRLIMWATELHPLTMGILVAVLVGMALTLPISSAAICAGLGLTGLAGGAALAGCCAQMVGFAVMSFRKNRWGGLVSQGLGTIGVWTGWTDPGAFDWTGLLLVSFVLPAVICLLIALVFRKMDRIRPGDLSI